MPTPLSGPGIGLPLQANLYPSELYNAPYDLPGSRVALAPGDELPIQAGTWLINTGIYCTIEYLDPVTNTWSMGSNAAWVGGHVYVKSDGFNVRVANRLGCPVSAVVAAYGSGYVQASTTVVPTPGNSTWVPIVGGQLSLGTATIVSAGAGYGVAPLLFIPPPPPAATNPNGVGGIPAAGFLTIASGTVSGLSLTNPGAGYPSAPTPVILPNPSDPNINIGITQAAITFSLGGAGSITGALCTNPGAPLSNPNQITLTIAGAGTSASLIANVLQTVTAVSISGQGLGYGTLSALLTTVGGAPTTGSISNNPDALLLAWRPRPAQVGLSVAAVGTLSTQLGTIYDGGLFLTNTAPNYVIMTQPATGIATVTTPTLALTMGSRADIVSIQPAP